MRDIKFRAWDKESKKMHYISVNWNLGMIQANPNDWELMQFTGLKDKNWKEIYEADIVNDFGGADGMDRIGVVQFDESIGAFVMTGVLSYNYTFTGGAADDLEVIGNIHENPELLEGVKT